MPNHKKQPTKHLGNEIKHTRIARKIPKIPETTERLGQFKQLM